MTASDASTDDTAITPFWQRLHSFFMFPLQTEPLILAALLSLLSYALLMPFLFPIAAVLVIAFVSAHYAFKVAALASRGVLHSRDYNRNMMDPEWKSLPWALFGVLVVHGLVIGFLSRLSPWLGLIGSLVSSLVLPATFMVLIQSGRMLPALNPFELLATMFDIGKQYLLLCLFLFLLQVGMPQALSILLPITPRLLLLPVFVFVTIYFSWVMAALIGYVMYQHHGSLDIDVLQRPEADAAASAAPQRPEVIEARRRDAEVSALVQAGNVNEAIAQAREWVRTSTNPLADQRRYHRVLLLDDLASGRLINHTPDYIALLVAQNHAKDALGVLNAVQTKLPDFALNSPADTIALAEQAWKQMDAKRTLKLLHGFDKRFPRTDEVPRACELVICALKQGLARGDMALPIYQSMQRRYPDHAATQEAAWVLRDELKSA
ncbi:hypothetical protein [Ottowia sp.]|uniref:hypothetical protein n=1 Tax=Ottowia sp. TaxID=1898956 RepID=UPI003A8A37B0